MCKGKCKCIEKLKEIEGHVECPKCGAEEGYLIDSADPQFEGFLAFLGTECLACGASWIDTYKFTGKREFQPDVEDYGFQSIPTEQ